MPDTDLQTVLNGGYPDHVRRALGGVPAGLALVPVGDAGAGGVHAGSSRVSLLAWCLWYLAGLFRLFQDAMQGGVRPQRKSAV